ASPEMTELPPQEAPVPDRHRSPFLYDDSSSAATTTVPRIDEERTVRSCRACLQQKKGSIATTRELRWSDAFHHARPFTAESGVASYQWLRGPHESAD